MTTVEPFSISRVFDAPRKLVYQANIDPAHLSKWMGAAGYEPIFSAMDFRVGGSYHYGLRAPDGSTMWGKQVYREIVPDERLVLLQSFSDEHGGLARHPMAPTWPLQMLSTTTFEDAPGGKTKMTVSWAPYEADDAANATFDAARAGMKQGFGGTFAKLDAHLAATACQLMTSRVVDAPRELVWKAFTDPAHVNAWWGPDGFQNVDVEQDVRVGGAWKFKMVGPDGVVYPNKATYLELQPPARLVYDHGDWDRVHFRAEITLDELANGKTLVTLSLTLPSREARDGVVGYAIDGGRQTLAKLAVHVAGMASA